MVVDVCEILFEAIVESLAEGEKVKIAGFGSFHTSSWGGYTSKQTGRDIPVKHICKFTRGKATKTAAMRASELG